MSPRLVDLKETMRLLGVKKTSAYQLIKNGELHPVKIGRKTLFLKAQVFQFIESRATEARAAMARNAGSQFQL